MPLRWTIFDRVNQCGCPHIKESGTCFYLMTRKRGGYDASDANSKISNLKKSLKYKNQPQWQYKEHAINEFACDIQELFNNLLQPDRLSHIALVPIPPSKALSDPQYDDRIVRVCAKAAQGSGMRFADLLHNKSSADPYHANNKRRTVEDISQNLYIAEPIPNNIEAIFLVDDVLTTGAHFAACKDVLQKAYQNTYGVNLPIFGIFWAKQEYIPPSFNPPIE